MSAQVIVSQTGATMSAFSSSAPSTARDLLELVVGELDALADEGDVGFDVGERLVACPTVVGEAVRLLGGGRSNDLRAQCRSLPS
jgi:hypothetical protein